MKHPSLIVETRQFACALAALGLLSASPAGLAQTPAPVDKKGAATPAMQGMGAGSMEMHGTMMSMMKNMDSVTMSGDPDRDFAAMMKIHHQGAIDMAQVELKSGKDAKMRALAKRIIDAQQKEIKEIDGWLGKGK